MKKVLISLFLVFIFCTSSFGTDNVSFIYINGSNNNDEKMDLCDAVHFYHDGRAASLCSN